MSFKGFCIFKSGGRLFGKKGIILAILVAGHQRNISVKLL